MFVSLKFNSCILGFINLSMKNELIQRSKLSQDIKFIYDKQSLSLHQHSSTVNSCGLFVQVTGYGKFIIFSREAQELQVFQENQARR